MKDNTHWLDNSIEPFSKFEKAHTNSIETLQFSPLNAGELATGSHDHLIKLWDINKLKELNTFSGHTAGIWSLTYSIDGKQIISGSPDKQLKVWDVKSGKNVATLKEHQNKVYWVQASDNGVYLASGGEDGHLMVWDLRKMKLVKNIEASKDIVYHVHFTPQSKHFFSSDSLGTIKAFDSQTFENIATTNTKQSKHKVFALQSQKLPNGDYQIFAGQENKTIVEYTFNPNNPEFIQDSQQDMHFDAIQSMAIDKTNSKLGTGCRDGTARVWSIGKHNNQHMVQANLLGHKQKVAAIEFHSTSRIVATCSWDQNVHLYKL